MSGTWLRPEWDYTVLVRLMDEAHMDRGTLATKLGGLVGKKQPFDKNTVQRWLTGMSSPTRYEHVVALAHMFDVRPEDFYKPAGT